MVHETHPEILKRLRRAHGHLAGIIRMIEEQRGCLEIAQQLQAVVNAVDNAKATLIHDHIDHCLDQAVNGIPQERRASLQEFKEITKYL